ncbi:hypothetical protein H0H93_016936 [Arthromyces matolae]|nr:hypothetical protein H0H93_016936 [Arthromyces matolae]
MPWNFQHNIHVDEGYMGLPPSWSLSLAKAGFSEEEIAEIQSRRSAGSRSPGSTYLYTARPASPAYTPAATVSNTPILTNPLPRSTSLARGQHGQGQSQMPSPPPMHPPIPSVGSPIPMPPTPIMSPYPHQLQSHHHHPSIASLASSARSHATSTSVSSFIQEAPTQKPSTPPRTRPFLVNNDLKTSSPPSYNSPGRGINVKVTISGSGQGENTIEKKPIPRKQPPSPPMPPLDQPSSFSQTTPQPQRYRHTRTISSTSTIPPPQPPPSSPPPPPPPIISQQRTPASPSPRPTPPSSAGPPATRSAGLTPPPTSAISTTSSSSSNPLSPVSPSQFPVPPSYSHGFPNQLPTPPLSKPSSHTPDSGPSTPPNSSQFTNSNIVPNIPSPESNFNHSSSPSQFTPSITSTPTTKRLTALPPRLSLHKSKDSTDLASWGEALLSGMSMVSEGLSTGSWDGPEEGKGTFARKQEAAMGGGGEKVMVTNSVYYEKAEESLRMSTQGHGKPTQTQVTERQSQSAKKKVVGLLNVGFRVGEGNENGEGEEEGPSSSFVEPARTARYDPNATSWDEDDYVGSGEEAGERWARDVNRNTITPASIHPHTQPQFQSQHIGHLQQRQPSPSPPHLQAPANPTPDEIEIELGEEEEIPIFTSSASTTSVMSDLPSPLWDDIEGMLSSEKQGMGGGEAVGETISPTVGLGVPGPATQRRESTRSSTSTVMLGRLGQKVEGMSGEKADINAVRNVGNYIIGQSPVVERRDEGEETHIQHGDTTFVAVPAATKRAAPPSPLSSNFGSEESSSGGSGGSRGTGSNPALTPSTEEFDDVEKGLDSSLMYYLDGAMTPDPSRGEFEVNKERYNPYSGYEEEDVEEQGLVEEEEEEEDDDGDEAEAGVQFIHIQPSPPHLHDAHPASRPRILISPTTASPHSRTSPNSPHLHPPSPVPPSATSATSANSLTTDLTPNSASITSPFQRYPGWLSSIVAPLSEFIDESIDPRQFYLDLHEIAEGESGSVYAARLVDSDVIKKLRLPAEVRRRDWEEYEKGGTTVVAIKSVAIMPTGSPKLVDLEKELRLMRVLGGSAVRGVLANVKDGNDSQGQGQEEEAGIWKENIVGMAAVYVDLVEDALWIRMELMERSLADIIGLVPSGLILGDRSIARFANDILQALDFLQRHRIAHRDVRSDNLLINKDGVLKLTDFSNAVQVTKESSMCSDVVGVAYWQAPEVRSLPYDALKVDVWSLGATVWEMAEAEPPFAETQQFGDRWPPLSRPHLFSTAYHEFLRLCSEPPAVRPSPAELIKTPFVRNACGRGVIVQLISQCVAIEQVLLEGDATRGSIQE